MGPSDTSNTFSNQQNADLGPTPRGYNKGVMAVQYANNEEESVQTKKNNESFGNQDDVKPEKKVKLDVYQSRLNVDMVSPKFQNPSPNKASAK